MACGAGRRRRRARTRAAAVEPPDAAAAAAAGPLAFLVQHVLLFLLGTYLYAPVRGWATAAGSFWHHALTRQGPTIVRHDYGVQAAGSHTCAAEAVCSCCLQGLSGGSSGVQVCVWWAGICHMSDMWYVMACRHMFLSAHACDIRYAVCITAQRTPDCPMTCPSGSHSQVSTHVFAVHACRSAVAMVAGHVVASNLLTSASSAAHLHASKQKQQDHAMFMPFSCVVS